MDTQAVVAGTIEKYERFVNPAVARLFRFMGLASVEWSAEGSIIRDIEGREFIDCLGGYGVFSVGHRHPAVIAAVREQLDRMPLASKVLFNQPMGDLAALLAEISPGDLCYSFFGNSGAEAVEGALKAARLATRRPKVVAAVNSFHGKTMGALSATGRDLFRDPFQPLLTGFGHVPFGDADALNDMVDDETAAVILEPIQGEGGIIVPPEGYMRTAREICNCAGALLIADEVQTGLGRTGRMFAVDAEDVVPDILVTAKALGGGVMPIGAFTAHPAVWESFITSPFIHTSTFGGNPLACAAAIAAIGVVRSENLAERARRVGGNFMDGLEKVRQAYPDVIREVRGRGLMIGLELTKEGIGGFLMSEMINSGILVAYTLNNPKVIRIEPPLNIPESLTGTVVAAVGAAAEKAHAMIDDL